jgi:hypothetical protein
MRAPDAWHGGPPGVELVDLNCPARAVDLTARYIREDYSDTCTLWFAHIHVGG